MNYGMYKKVNSSGILKEKILSLYEHISKWQCICLSLYIYVCIISLIPLPDFLKFNNYLPFLEVMDKNFNPM